MKPVRSDWIVDVSKVTALAHDIHDLVQAGDLTAATRWHPTEPYRLPDHIKGIIDVT
jgi:hypothetical protein